MKKLFLLLFTLGFINLCFGQTINIHTDTGVDKYILANVDSITFSLTSPAPTEGLVAYYPFNGNANDESVNLNHGIVHGATLTTDRFGNPNSAYSFDGINDYIEAPHTPFLNFGSYFSISLFMSTSSSDGEYLISKGNAGNNYQWDVTTNNSPKNSAGFGLFDMNLNYGINGVSNVKDGLFHHIVVVRNGDSLTIYIDGQIDNAESKAGMGIADSERPLRIATRGDLISYSFFNGIIDDIRIYNRALSEAEVQLLFNE